MKPKKKNEIKVIEENIAVEVLSPKLRWRQNLSFG